MAAIYVLYDMVENKAQGNLDAKWGSCIRQGIATSLIKIERDRRDIR